MAEGGPLKVPDVPRPVSEDSHLLDCPICLEQLQEPKSLPCLHSFCQECLSIYITKDLSGKMALATAFPCPVCRKMTSPVNMSEDRKKWAQQFPTNDLVKDLIKATTHKPLYCKPCERKGNMGTPAMTWCKTYNILFCAACKVGHHDLIHEGCETVDVTGKDGIMQQQVTEHIQCAKHTKKMCYYCEDHQMLGCSRCITIDHRQCGVVMTTEEYCDKLKEDSQLEDLKKSLQKTTDAIKLLLKEFGEHLQTLVDDQNSGLKSLADLRKKVDIHLDAMQKSISDKLISSYKNERENLEMSIQKYERLMSSIQNTIEASEAAVQRNDNIDTILLYQRGQAEDESYKKMIMEMKKSFKSVRIKHTIEPSLLKLDKDSPLSLGKVTVEKKPKTFPDGISTVTALSECCVKKIGKFSIKCPSDGRYCSSSGVVYLPGEHIVVGDSSNYKVKLFKTSGKYLDELNVSGAPFDMCRVNDDTVAAAVPKFGILVIKVQQSKLIPSFKIKMSNCEQPYGITYSGPSFIVSTLKDMYKVLIDGSSTYLCTYPASCWHLVYDPRTEYIYSDQYTLKSGYIVVHKLSDGTYIPEDPKKVGVLKATFGIDIDEDGNVYVCGQASSNVVQMSGNGTNIRELLRSSDGVHRPTAISVYGNKFVVTKESSHDTSEVHVFQLY